MWELATNVSFLLLVLYFTLPALAGWVVRDWMPAILEDQFHIGQGRAGVSATLFVNLAALAGAPLGIGRHAIDAVEQRHPGIGPGDGHAGFRQARRLAVTSSRRP